MTPLPPRSIFTSPPHIHPLPEAYRSIRQWLLVGNTDAERTDLSVTPIPGISRQKPRLGHLTSSLVSHERNLGNSIHDKDVCLNIWYSSAIPCLHDRTIETWASPTPKLNHSWKHVFLLNTLQTVTELWERKRKLLKILLEQRVFFLFYFFFDIWNHHFSVAFACQEQDYETCILLSTILVHFFCLTRCAYAEGGKNLRATVRHGPPYRTRAVFLIGHYIKNI